MEITLTPQQLFFICLNAFFLGIFFIIASLRDMLYPGKPFRYSRETVRAGFDLFIH